MNLFQELKYYDRLLREGYLDGNSSMNDEYVENDEPMYGDEMMSRQQPQMRGGDEDNDEVNMADGDTSDKINQIRMLALDGIQEYAENVDDPNYEFFKKIWLMCDKVCSEKEEGDKK